MAQQRCPEDYTVAIICALEIELRAVRGMLNEVHPRLPLSPDTGDTNIYTCGELHGHRVVACCLPGQYGKGSAAGAATNLARTFTAIKWRFLVGVGGGIPSDMHNIRLGDVVVSMPHGKHGGVVQYDLGKETTGGFEPTGFLCPPPAYLRNAAISMKTDHSFAGDNRIAEHIATFMASYPRLTEFARPEPATGPDAGPKIHYGLIASGDKLVIRKSYLDEIVRQCGDVLCVEMEAAGISTAYECIVIRGISDLADEHKNDDWQSYAAAAAAAVAKEMLERVVPAPTERARPGPASRALEGNGCDGGDRDFWDVFQGGSGIQQVGSGNTAITGNRNNVYR